VVKCVSECVHNFFVISLQCLTCSCIAFFENLIFFKHYDFSVLPSDLGDKIFDSKKLLHHNSMETFRKDFELVSVMNSFLFCSAAVFKMT